MKQYLYMSHSVFPSPDIERTSEYYVTVMGFQAVKYLNANEPHICLYRDDTEIILTSANSDRVYPNRELYGYGYDAYFITDDQQSLQNEFLEKGAKIVRPLQKTDYHNQEFVVEDIDGRWIGFGIKDKQQYAEVLVMMELSMMFKKIWNEWPDKDSFSGVFSVSSEQGIVFEKCCGYRNRSEQLPNNKDTAFGIASGTKMFTGLAVCKLIDENRLSLNDRLCDVLTCNMGQIDSRVTVFHLLTHTSGVGDYIDEESEDNIEQLQALYNKYPVYLWEDLEYYLQMIAPLPPKFEPGARFSYSNSGYVLLGLVIEAVSGLSYQQFMKDTIIEPLKLEHTGFYRTDSLPANTAHGYIYDEAGGQWCTNIFNLPVRGGSDGGIYTCVGDLDKLWRAVFSNAVLSEEMTQAFLKQQSVMNEVVSYGLGVYRCCFGDKLFYYAVGGDFGVDFYTAYYPEKKIVVSALGNTEINTYTLMEAVVSAL